MQTHTHVVVWIDHHQARIIHIGLSGTDEVVLESKLPAHLHHKANAVGSGHASEDKDFLKRTADAIRGAEQVLIMGPSTAKTVLRNYLRDHDPKFAQKTVTVEPADHPSDREIIAHAKRHFGFDEARRQPH